MNENSYVDNIHFLFLEKLGTSFVRKYSKPLYTFLFIIFNIYLTYSLFMYLMQVKSHLKLYMLQGSTAVGKLLYRDCSSTIKHIGLELGGNAPFIVFNSAKLSNAIKSLMIAKFRNSGQVSFFSHFHFVLYLISSLSSFCSVSFFNMYTDENCCKLDYDTLKNT